MNLTLVCQNNISKIKSIFIFILNLSKDSFTNLHKVELLRTVMDFLHSPHIYKRTSNTYFPVNSSRKSSCKELANMGLVLRQFI